MALRKFFELIERRFMVIFQTGIQQYPFQVIRSRRGPAKLHQV